MQKSKGDIMFFKYWKNIKHEFRIQKAIKCYNKVIKTPISLSNGYSSNAFLFRKIVSYAFSGFSIIFIGYLLIIILNNYPPKELGITP
ncbi:MAG: hypothetical protein ACXWFC_08325 [Nitrososphaeraceae archaeon]